MLLFTFLLPLELAFVCVCCDVFVVLSGLLLAVVVCRFTGLLCLTFVVICV